MKAFVLTLLLAISLPLGLFAAAGAHDEPVDVADVAGELAAHGAHGEDAAHEAAPSQNKLTMITEKFGVSLPTLIAQMVNFILDSSTTNYASWRDLM